jgi:hypothetical protein
LKPAPGKNPNRLEAGCCRRKTVETLRALKKHENTENPPIGEKGKIGKFKPPLKRGQDVHN